MIRQHRASGGRGVPCPEARRRGALLLPFPRSTPEELALSALSGIPASIEGGRAQWALIAFSTLAAAWWPPKLRRPLGPPAVCLLVRDSRSSRSRARGGLHRGARRSDQRGARRESPLARTSNGEASGYGRALRGGPKGEERRELGNARPCRLVRARRGHLTSREYEGARLVAMREPSWSSLWVWPVSARSTSAPTSRDRGDRATRNGRIGRSATAYGTDCTEAIGELSSGVDRADALPQGWEAKASFPSRQTFIAGAGT